MTDTLNDFVASLPVRYRERFSGADMRLHQHAAEAQVGSDVVVEVFQREPELTAICIVGLDQPGFLARVTDALVLCELDIVNAEAFTRLRAGGAAQALDVFWVRHSSGRPASEADVEHLRQELRQRSTAAPSELPSHQQDGAMSDTRVRFIENESGALDTLEIETDDRAGLLLALSRTLYAQKVQIVYSEIRTHGGRCVDRFQIAEFDGSEVSPARRLQIQVAVLSAAEPAKRLSSLPPR